jgi:pimeloyl-ACP methyl ester carboxylesterase
MMLKLLLGLVAIYVLICLFAFAFQGRALFPVEAARSRQPLPPDAKRLHLTAPDGTRLVGIHLPPADAGPPGPVILGFPGNAWNADTAAEYLRDVYPGSDVVTFHYRGYEPSGGRPGAAALLADSLLVRESVSKRFPGRPIVAVGFSIGSGVAAHVAGRGAVSGAILVTPFDSLASVAAGHYPWLPVRLLWRHRLDPAAELAGSRVRVAILAGGRDTLIPAARTEALRKAVPNLVYDRIIGGAGHNDIYRASIFQQAMDDALAKVTGSS